MKERVIVKATIVRENGTLNTYNEDRVEMEVHDFYDYLTLKHITKGSKWLAVGAKFANEVSREEDRIKDEKTL